MARFGRGPLTRASNAGVCEKSRFIFTIERQQELAYDLSNGAISNDLKGSLSDLTKYSITHETSLR